MKAISLFSSAGIGELGISKHGIEILAANEVRRDRCGLYRTNFPETQMFEGDIWEQRSDLVAFAKRSLEEKSCFWFMRLHHVRGCQPTESANSEQRSPPDDGPKLTSATVWSFQLWM